MLSGASSASTDELVAEMLHALGQPLTVLGSLRLLACQPARVSEGAIEELAEQAERATEIYRAVRLLLEGGDGLVEVQPQLAEWRRRASARGVALQVVFPVWEAWKAEGRVVEGVLSAAVQSCARGEAVVVGETDGWMEVRGGDGIGQRVPWELKVAVVAGKGREEGAGGHDGAGAGMVYRLQPFRCRVRLKAETAQPERLRVEGV